jgi:hypothetical protein
VQHLRNNKSYSTIYGKKPTASYVNVSRKISSKNVPLKLRILCLIISCQEVIATFKLDVRNMKKKGNRHMQSGTAAK